MAVPDFTGEFGGLMATMYIAGCFSGFSFAGMTIVKLYRDKAKSLEQAMDELKEEYRDKTEKLTINYTGQLDRIDKSHEDRIKQLRDFITAQELRCDKRISDLENRLKEVEDSRVNIALNRQD